MINIVIVKGYRLKLCSWCLVSAFNEGRREDFGWGVWSWYAEGS